METDHRYYARRATDERSAAEQATDARARQIHLELASRFEQLSVAVGEVDRAIGPKEPAWHRHSSGFTQF